MPQRRNGIAASAGWLGRRKVTAMEESGCSALLSDLLCPEDGASLGGGEEPEEEAEEEEEEEEGVDGIVFVNDCELSETEDEYIGLLVSRESSFEANSSSGCFSSASGDDAPAIAAGDWLKCARSGAVRWILKTRGYLGFSLRTAYLSVTYLDRFFLKRTINRGQSWAIQLLAVACLSLAAKMEECRVPALTEFPVEEYRFESKSILRMELLVLNTLDWRMSLVTPFLYLNYFASRLGGEAEGKGLFHRAIGFIFATTEGMNLVEYRPSAIAAAAILAASGKASTRGLLEDKMGVISTCGSLETDHVLSCYNVMIRESRKQKRGLKLPRFLIPSSLRPPACPSTDRSGDAIDDDPAFSSASCKRRRLSLSSCSCNCPVSNKNHS